MGIVGLDGYVKFMLWSLMFLCIVFNVFLDMLKGLICDFWLSSLNIEFMVSLVLVKLGVKLVDCEIFRVFMVMVKKILKMLLKLVFFWFINFVLY